VVDDLLYEIIALQQFFGLMFTGWHYLAEKIKEHFPVHVTSLRLLPVAPFAREYGTQNVPYRQS
jgi:hypothetical protein